MAASSSHTGYSYLQQEQYNLYLQRLKEEFYEAWNAKPEQNAKLSDFDFKSVLGNGAFGVVYLVKHVESEKYYAMKTVEKATVVKLKQIEHSFNEKRILNGLKFPFTIYMKYFMKDNVYLYYVLPFVSGGEMFRHLRKTGKFEENAAKFYGAQVILALEYLHACDLVYRDLKPENILIDPLGYIKLTDFGFCKQLKTCAWTLCGTPEYLAPEIILSKGYGLSVDWWSTGVLLYEMSAGFPPFYAPEPMGIYEKIVAGKYHCPQHFSNELRDIISHTLQVDTTRRYGNLRDGVLSFKNHYWFKEIDWVSILHCRITPPFIPKVRYPGDTTNFESHVFENLKESPICRFQEEFIDF